jgi:hypothetical protein
MRGRQWSDVGILLILSGCGGWADSSSREAPVERAGPDSIVVAYLESDATGQRLSGSSGMSLVTWSEEPGWDFATVVAEIGVGSTDRDQNDRAFVGVSYRIVGTVQPVARLEYSFGSSPGLCVKGGAEAPRYFV